MSTTPKRKSVGRPVGGGNTAEQSREALLDAAERCIAVHGYRASTMEIIAGEAGYSRAGIYRQFPNRNDLLEALVSRATQRHARAIVARLPRGAGPADMIVESLVIVATELVRDPVIRTISEQSDDGGVAYVIANHAGLAQAVETLIAEIIAGDGAAVFRSSLRARDVAQFLVITAVSLLLEVVPGTRDPDLARRYVEVFVLPAILKHPPRPQPVFTQ